MKNMTDSKKVLIFLISFGSLLLFSIISTTAYHYESPIHEVLTWATLLILGFFSGYIYSHFLNKEIFGKIRDEIYNLMPKLNEQKQESLNELLWHPEGYLLKRRKLP